MVPCYGTLIFMQTHSVKMMACFYIQKVTSRLYLYAAKNYIKIKILTEYVRNARLQKWFTFLIYAYATLLAN